MDRFGGAAGWEAESTGFRVLAWASSASPALWVPCHWEQLKTLSLFFFSLSVTVSSAQNSCEGFGA